MSRYRLVCTMRKMDDHSHYFPVNETGLHPDLIKQALCKKHPGYEMLNIDIADITPTISPWDSRDKTKKATNQKKETMPIQLDQSWRKELTR